MKTEIGLSHRSCFLRFAGIFFLIAANLPWACSVSSDSTKNKNRPNVVLILVDALRQDKLGCYGFRDDISPEIDDMARKGVQFKNIISQCSWTRPSVGSILTSLYPRTLGLYRKDCEILDDRFTTLAEILKTQDYLTVGITANPNMNKVYNFHQGFDHYVESDVIWEWMRKKLGQAKLSSTHQLKSNSEVFETAMNILDEDKHRPFFLFVHLMGAHTRSNAEIRPEFRSMFDDYPRDEEREYYLRVRQSSYDIGNFVQTLLPKPGCGNTLFIISADHGEGLYDHPKVPDSRWHGYLLYDSQVKVPLILYHPNSGQEPRQIEQNARLIDLLPTILDYLKISKKPSGIVGKSLLPLIKGTKERINLPKYFVAETRTNNNYKLAVYSKSWIYIENRDHYPGVNPFELQSRYRRQDGKWTDLINEKPDIAAGMREFLKKWEKKFPESKITPCREKASPETVEQLKSLGYLK
jgi:arylsulfatase A-like enzyme